MRSTWLLLFFDSTALTTTRCGEAQNNSTALTSYFALYFEFQTVIHRCCDDVRSRTVGLSVEPQLMHSPTCEHDVIDEACWWSQARCEAVQCSRMPYRTTGVSWGWVWTVCAEGESGGEPGEGTMRWCRHRFSCFVCKNGAFSSTPTPTFLSRSASTSRHKHSKCFI